MTSGSGAVLPDVRNLRTNQSETLLSLIMLCFDITRQQPQWLLRHASMMYYMAKLHVVNLSFKKELQLVVW